MNNIFSEKKKELMNITAPDDMETKLKLALHNKRRKNKNVYKSAIILLICVMFVTYNFDVLAYTSKKLLGYDEIMTNSLKQINEEMYGQIINKEIMVCDGINMILDGVVLDGSQLVVYYTLRSEKGEIDYINSNIEIKGLFNSYWTKSGVGKYNEERTELKCIAIFNKPHFYEKKLKIIANYKIDSKIIPINLDFKLDWSKALGFKYKIPIDLSVTKSDTSVDFNKLLIYPTKTILSGNLASTLDLIKEKMIGDRVRYSDLEVDLQFNGEKLNLLGSNMSSTRKGIEFNIEYESLQKQLSSLKEKEATNSSLNLIIKSLSISKDINKTIKVYPNTKLSFNYDNKTIDILDVKHENNNTIITVQSEEDVKLLDVCLFSGNKEFKYIKTNDIEHIKTTEGKILYKRQYEFENIDKQYELNIGKIIYTKEFNQKYKIPLR